MKHQVSWPRWESVVHGGLGGQIGRITLTGQITEYPTLAVNGEPFAITAGPADGLLWFGETSAIGRLIPDTKVPHAPAELRRVDRARSITLGPDGALWTVDDTW